METKWSYPYQLPVKKQRNSDTTILFDYDGTLQNIWGMPEDNYTVVILDKNRICRALFIGKIPESDNEKIIQHDNCINKRIDL